VLAYFKKKKKKKKKIRRNFFYIAFFTLFCLRKKVNNFSKIQQVSELSTTRVNLKTLKKRAQKTDGDIGGGDNVDFSFVSHHLLLRKKPGVLLTVTSGAGTTTRMRRK